MNMIPASTSVQIDMDQEYYLNELLVTTFGGTSTYLFISVRWKKFYEISTLSIMTG